MAGWQRPHHKDTHDSIVKPPNRRWRSWDPNLQPESLAPKMPTRRKGRKKRGARVVGEREQATLAVLERLGTASSSEIAAELGEDMTTNLVAYSLGILREHRLVTAERVGNSNVWTRA